MVILAGGSGTRIQEITKGKPKLLAPVNGKPFIELKLKSLEFQGVSEVLFLLGHGAQQITDYLKIRENHLENNIRLSFVLDRCRDQGTGKALVQALDLLPSRFTLTYGDNLLNFPLAALWKTKNTTMVVTSDVGAESNKNIWTNKKNIVKYDKNQSQLFGDYMDYGYLRFKKSDLLGLDRAEQFKDLGEIIQALANKKRIEFLETSEKWFEIGTPEALRATERHITSGNVLGISP